jgi:formate dehydrogenase major subunit
VFTQVIKRPQILPPLRGTDEGQLVSLTINGQEVKAHTGTTILEAAKSAGIKIPHLCIIKQLEPYGGCRVCVVEVEGEDRPVASCATYCAEGINVTTESDKLSRLRKTYLELMLSDHNAYCLPPCKYGCPTNVDAPAFIGLMVEGKYEEAQMALKANLPFPATVGRICPHPCESNCRRGELDEPLSIRLSHRFVGDIAISKGLFLEAPAPSTGKRIAVIGAGPAGLTNAYYLALKGHGVTIFEALPEPGGMLRYGIPEYRLPKRLIDAELEPLWKMGVELKTNTAMGPDCSIDSLIDDGYDAVFIGIGAHESNSMRVEGEDLDGVYPVVEYLREVALNNPPEIGDKVAVIGGGFSAMDAARVSVRLGAKEVSVIYRRTQAEMPAHEIEVRDAQEEGVKFVYLAAPVELVGEGGKLTGVRCQKMELGEPDDSGRRRPQPVEGSEYIIELDSIIPAIGQSPKIYFNDDESGEKQPLFDESCGIDSTKWKTIDANPDTFQTRRPEVFVAGDAFTGAATVVEAVGAAKRAAGSMDAWLRGEDMAAYASSLPAPKPEMLSIPAYREDRLERQMSSNADAAERQKNFLEVEHGFSEQAAVLEGKRCLQCICEGVESCKLRRYSIAAGLLSEESNRFVGKQHMYGRDTQHDFIQRDPNRCIDCGRCVRTCKYITGAGVYDFTGRGADMIVSTPFDVTLDATDCVSCGRCAGVCPTGALFFRPRTLIDWHLDLTRCIFCGDCVEVCPADALAQTADFELAQYKHEGLHRHLLDTARGVAVEAPVPPSGKDQVGKGSSERFSIEAESSDD